MAGAHSTPCFQNQSFGDLQPELTIVDGGGAQHAVLVLLPLRLEAVLGAEQDEDQNREAGLRLGRGRGRWGGEGLRAKRVTREQGQGCTAGGEAGCAAAGGVAGPAGCASSSKRPQHWQAEQGEGVGGSGRPKDTFGLVPG
jgi:hypothetical protein